MSWLAERFAGLWAKVALVAGLVVAALTALLALVRVFKKAGADAQRVERAKADAKVEARVEAVKRLEPSAVEERLEKGSF